MQFNADDRATSSSRTLQRLGGASPEIALAVLDGLPGMVAFWTNELVNVFANKAYAAWFGRSPEEMVGMHMRNVLGEDLIGSDHKPWKVVVTASWSKCSRHCEKHNLTLA